MTSTLFWSLFAVWALICIGLDQLSSTPIFKAERSFAEPVGDPD